MFCSNCGKEATGKYCSECGTPLFVEETNNNVQNENSNSYINGVEVNLSEIVAMCGKDRINAIKILREKTHLGLKEAKDVIDEAYRDAMPSKPAGSGFWARAKEEAEKQRFAKIQEQQALKERIKQMDRDGIAYCPRCYSISLSANKKGFGIGKAVVGAAVTFSPLGLVAGNIGAKKVRVTCLKCGHQFWAGQK